MNITLDKYEFLIAVQVGAYRQMSCLKQEKKHRYGADDSNAWSMHIEGACGEAAVAKAYNIYWSGNMDLFSAAGDVNSKHKRIEVRTTAGENNRLIVHANEPSDAVFILVIGRAPSFRIVGWCYGYEACKQEFFDDPTGHRPAYFVPQKNLKPIHELSI